MQFKQSNLSNSHKSFLYCIMLNFRSSWKKWKVILLFLNSTTTVETVYNVQTVNVSLKFGKVKNLKKFKIWKSSKFEKVENLKNLKIWKFEKVENLKIWKSWKFEKVEELKIWKSWKVENLKKLKIWKS